MRTFLPLIVACILLVRCGVPEPAAPNAQLVSDTGLLHRNLKQLTEVIIHDAFSPPVASRIYAYTTLASYEALRYSKPGYPSLTAQLNGFAPMPRPEAGKPYNHLLAATKAFFTVAKKITFSKDTLLNYEQDLYNDFSGLLDADTYKRSVAFGEAIGAAVLERTTKDNYKETRGMAKFLGSGEEGKWKPTPPDYMDAAEPNWHRILPLALDSNNQFKCPAPPAFSTDTASDFFRYAKEVYTTTTTLTPQQKEIAHYWDDNPFVVEHAGHLMYANKKITPVGHWMGIAGIAAGMEKLSPVETAQNYALTAVAMFDTFIGCWEEKFRTQVIRPITMINDHIDPNWQPLLQTPPFPEYTSGHSGISAAAASVLTARFGDNFHFEDTSDLEYIGMKRKFRSFSEAAAEASVSRVYGGIHYRSGVEAGADQGVKMSTYILNKIKTKE